MTDAFECSKCGSARAQWEADSIGYTMTCLTCGHVRYFDNEGGESAPPSAPEQEPTVEVQARGETGGDGTDDEPVAADHGDMEAGPVAESPPVETGVEAAETDPAEVSPKDDVPAAEDSPKDDVPAAEEAGAAPEAGGQPEAAKVPRQDRRRLGICMKCGLEPARENFQTGEMCAEANRQYQKKRYDDTVERKRLAGSQAGNQPEDQPEDEQGSQSGEQPTDGGEQPQPHETALGPAGDEAGAGSQSGEFRRGETYSSEQITLNYLRGLEEFMETAIKALPAEKSGTLGIQLEAIKIVILIMPAAGDEVAEFLRESGKLG